MYMIGRTNTADVTTLPKASKQASKQTNNQTPTYQRKVLQIQQNIQNIPVPFIREVQMYPKSQMKRKKIPDIQTKKYQVSCNWHTLSQILYY